MARHVASVTCAARAAGSPMAHGARARTVRARPMRAGALALALLQAAPSGNGVFGAHGSAAPGAMECGGPWPFSAACSALTAAPLATAVTLAAHDTPGSPQFGPAELCALCRAWAELDARIAPLLPSASESGGLSGGLSGGIYLYEQQVLAAAATVAAAARKHGGARVCETGFNAGHATLMWLMIPNVTVLTFDTLERDYQRAAYAHIAGGPHADRLTLVRGDTRDTLPALGATHPRARCDFVSPTVPSREHDDLVNLRRYASGSTVVMPTAARRDAVLGADGALNASLRAKLVCGPTRCAPARGANEPAELTYCVARYCAEPPLYMGRVLAELGARVLGRRITSADVVLVGDAQSLVPLTAAARAEGHTVHSLAGGDARHADELLVARVGRLPGWVLLLYVDTGGANDEAAAFAGMGRLLSRSTVTCASLSAPSLLRPAQPPPGATGTWCSVSAPRARSRLTHHTRASSAI